jgi:hypothetical protein
MAMIEANALNVEVTGGCKLPDIMIFNFSTFPCSASKKIKPY